MVFNNFKDNPLVEGEDDACFPVFQGVPVLNEFPRHPGAVGDGQHRISADLKGAVFPFRRKKRELKYGKFTHKFGICKAACIARFCFFGNQFNILVIGAINRCGEDTQFGPFYKNIKSALQLP